jgi:hypothetical protein
VCKVKLGILLIVLGLVCLVGIPSGNVSADDMTGSVTVNADLDYITVTPINPSVPISTSTYQFFATASYSNAPDDDVTNSANWSSSNTSVASVNPQGQVTLLALGSTTIKAEYQEETANTTLEVTAATSPPPGGGGGGIGSPAGTTLLFDYITGEGTIITDVIAESADGLVALYLPEGTIALQNNGQPLFSLSISENPAPPPPPGDSEFVTLAYNINPSGATFIPPALLTFKYNDSQLHAGVTEENMVFVTWLDRQWVELEDCIVDTVNNTVTVPTSHLSLFTVIAHTSPASFVITDMTVTPAEVYTDEIVTVSATITNTGDLTGSYEVIIKVDNKIIQTQMFAVNGSASRTVTVNVDPGSVGVHTVSVNSLSATYTVKELGQVAEITPTAVPGPSPSVPAATGEPAPINTPTASITPPAATGPTETLKGALPIQLTDNRMRIITGSVGGFLVIVALIILLIRRRHF